MSTSQAAKPAGKTEAEEEPPSLIHGVPVANQYRYLNDIISEKDFHEVTAHYPFVSTTYYMSLAGRDPHDPIMRQLCPSIEELTEGVSCSEDPLAEESNSPVPGLVHRYPDRVLMIVTNLCFMNCRHCTRKRLWKLGRRPCSLEEIRRMIGYIRQHPEVRDVVVSGGDPLTFSDSFLDTILSEIRSIPHVEIIRVGTRAPVVNPDRITLRLVEVLEKHRPVWLNTHFNHVREITSRSSSAVGMLLKAGIPVNNQSVLLKGVNDSHEAMRDLCHGLLRIGVRPYYLYHCDPVLGTAHFRTSISEGIEIIGKMQGFTSGLAVPTFVVDSIEGGGKIPLQPSYLVSADEGKMILRNYLGQYFVYEDPKKKVSV